MISPMTENVANIEARENLIRLMTANTENLKTRNAIKIKKPWKCTKQDSSDSSLSNSNFPTKVTIQLRYTIRRRDTRKITLSNYAQS